MSCMHHNGGVVVAGVTSAGGLTALCEEAPRKNGHE